ncbi:MAG: ParB N-terminal domain-containing protein [Pirellulaceae bacterium]|jgi:ParB-like chromosome segregation protein Spo0J|nr:ParB N-terminal domain-containing protein [Pirellulaceae bacterium]
MIANGKPVRGIDVPIVKLIPRRERKVGKKYYQRIEASLRAVGMIDPLIVFPQGDSYEILDGCLRYRILLELGVETVPCLIANEREGFTGNRMVNQLSASQEMRMLRKSLEELDEKTIADALGMQGIKHRLNLGLLKKLHERVAKAFEASKLNLQAAKELSHVKPERQAEILKLMESCNDYSVTFAKGLVLKTPLAKRAKPNGAKTPWTQADEKKSNLLKRLKEAEQQQDFYSGLYRQYTTNLLKLVIYVRSLLANPQVRAYLEANHGELVAMFQEVLESTER